MRLIQSNEVKLLKDGNRKFSKIGQEPILVDSFSDLIMKVAQLSFDNKDFLLFFRGQSENHLDENRKSTLLPSMYRRVKSIEDLELQDEILTVASKMLIAEIKKFDNLKVANDISRIKYLAWGILQHYEVCDTPLLDITQSLQVACSFASIDSTNKFGYVYVLALPYIFNRISINSEFDLVNVRLLSISPPKASRPFLQDGFLVGTEYFSNNISKIKELDFNRRLVAVFKFENSERFWGKYKRLNKKQLLPESDLYREICDRIKPWLVDNYDNNAIDVNSSNFRSILKYYKQVEQEVKKSDLKDDPEQLLKGFRRLSKIRKQILSKPDSSIKDISTLNETLDFYYKLNKNK